MLTGAVFRFRCFSYLWATWAHYFSRTVVCWQLQSSCKQSCFFTILKNAILTFITRVHSFPVSRFCSVILVCDGSDVFLIFLPYIHLSILHLYLLLLNQGHRGLLEIISGRRLCYTLIRLQIYHRATYRTTAAHAHTHSCWQFEVAN